jgi:hypothetical protein
VRGRQQKAHPVKGPRRWAADRDDRECRPRAYRFAILGLFLLAAPASSRAEVTRVDIQRREDVLGGKSFGSVGPYEKIVGKVYFAVDPDNPHNKIIVDLDKAPKNAQGKVEFSSDFYIIKPKDPSRGNGVVFFDTTIGHEAGQHWDYLMTPARPTSQAAP